MQAKHLLALAAAAVSTLGFVSCGCGDPALVAIPETDASAPTLHWEIAVLSQTPSGPISSMTQYFDPNTAISVKSTDKVDIYLIGVDNESGIKSLSTKGGFGYYCNPAGGGISIAIDGIFPEQGIDFSMLTKCGFREWKIAREALNVNLTCNTGTPANRMIGLTGEGKNHKDGTSSLNLAITVTD